MTQQKTTKYVRKNRLFYLILLSIVFLASCSNSNVNVFEEYPTEGESSKKYENKLKSLLKNKRIKVYKIKFINDKNEPLIRLADFMAGLIRSYFDNKNTDNVYLFGLLKNKIKIPD